MKVVRESLNEVLLGKFKSRYNGDMELYKNPPSIKRIGFGCRGISDKNGNLYVGTVQGIHVDIFDAMVRCKEFQYLDYYKYFDNIGIVSWQQLNDSKNLYLGESYSSLYIFEDEISKKYIKRFLKMKRVAEKMNPQFNFILKSINNSNSNARF